MSRARILVVAALVQNSDGEVLLTQRRPDQVLGSYWEFPGGKIELGESPEVALVRELAEELGVEARVGRIWDAIFHAATAEGAEPARDVYMMVYRCELSPATPPRAREVADWAWVPVARLRDYKILPADAPLVARLLTAAALSPGP